MCALNVRITVKHSEKKFPFSSLEAPKSYLHLRLKLFKSSDYRGPRAAWFAHNKSNLIITPGYINAPEIQLLAVSPENQVISAFSAKQCEDDLSTALEVIPKPMQSSQTDPTETVMVETSQSLVALLSSGPC